MQSVISQSTSSTTIILETPILSSRQIGRFMATMVMLRRAHRAIPHNPLPPNISATTAWDLVRWRARETTPKGLTLTPPPEPFPGQA